MKSHQLHAVYRLVAGMFVPVALVAIAALPTAAQADVVVSPLFSDCVMLQRGQPIRVWGRAEPGEDVRVSLGDATGSVAADAGGRWIIELPARDAGDNLELVVEGRNRIVFKDVILGDVWLCAGQSNMAWPLQAWMRQQPVRCWKVMPILPMCASASSSTRRRASARCLPSSSTTGI